MRVEAVADAPLVMVIDDDPEDAYLVRRGFSRLDRRSDIVHIPGGRALFDRLRPEQGPAPERLPDLVLLDVNMLSSSATPESVNRYYAPGANSYLCKPRDAGGMHGMARMVSDFWLGLADRPDTRHAERRGIPCPPVTTRDRR